MCFIYGGFIALLALFSGTWSGRGGLLFCAGFMVTVGLAIRRSLQPVSPSAPSPSLEPR
jgi:hypothetical protein